MQERRLGALLNQIREARLPAPEREHRFSRRRRWRIDLFFAASRVGIEFEGGAFSRLGAKRCPTCKHLPQGGHNTGTGFERNCEKYNEAQIAGILIIRVTAGMIRDGRAIDQLCRAIAARAKEKGDDHTDRDPVP